MKIDKAKGRQKENREIEPKTKKMQIRLHQLLKSFEIRSLLILQKGVKGFHEGSVSKGSAFYIKKSEKKGKKKA